MRMETTSHEWISSDGRIGITKEAQKELGEIVYVELPQIGQAVEKGSEIAVLESTKAAVDVYSPASGTVVAVNDELRNDPSLINTAPESDGWLCQIE